MITPPGPRNPKQELGRLLVVLVLVSAVLVTFFALPQVATGILAR